MKRFVWFSPLSSSPSSIFFGYSRHLRAGDKTKYFQSAARRGFQGAANTCMWCVVCSCCQLAGVAMSLLMPVALTPQSVTGGTLYIAFKGGSHALVWFCLCLLLSTSNRCGDAILQYISRLQRRRYESAAATQWLARPVSWRGEALSNSELQCGVFSLCTRVYLLQ